MDENANVQYWVCAANLSDSPHEFVAEGDKKQLERMYKVCSGPYADSDEADFWRYGGPHVDIQLLDDLSQQEIKWLLGRPELLDKEELDYLKNLFNTVRSF